MTRCTVLLLATFLTVPLEAQWRVLSPHDGRQSSPPEAVESGSPIQPGDVWTQDGKFRWLIDTLEVPRGIVGLSQGGGLADYEDATAAKLREGGFRWFRMDNILTPVILGCRPGLT